MTEAQLKQLEEGIVKAAKEVERLDIADTAAEEKVNTLERKQVEIAGHLKKASDFHSKISHDRIRAYWILGRCIVAFEKNSPDKGKRGKPTPRVRAIELAGNNPRYQRAKAIYDHFDSIDKAGDALKKKPFVFILDEIAAKKKDKRKAEGKKAPGRKANSVAKKVDIPKAQPGEQKAGTHSDTPVLTKKEEPITPEEIKLLKEFVDKAGGWNRAIYLVEEGYRQWQHANKNG